MDETFQLAPIGTCAPEDTQFIFVTATLPQVSTPHSVTLTEEHDYILVTLCTLWQCLIAILQQGGAES